MPWGAALRTGAWERRTQFHHIKIEGRAKQTA